MDIASVLIFSGYGPVYRHKNSSINLWESVHLKFPYAQQLPQKKSDEERVFIFYRSYGSNGQIPPQKALPPAPLKDEQTFIGLQDHRSSELALNHEKFRAIKKKLRW